jgi:PEP-CTERM motif
MRKRSTRFIFLLVVALPAINADAGTIIQDRSSLDKLLDGSAVTDNFENIQIGNQQISLDIGVPLNSSTILPAFAGLPEQGPGLVPNGVSFTALTSSGSLKINPPGFPTETDLTVTLGTAGGGGGEPPAPMFINFSIPVNALGLELLSPGLSFLNGTNTFSVTLFAQDDTTILQTHTFDIPTPIFVGGRQFFGVSEGGNIGSVRIESQTFVGIDDLTFGLGNTIPEPSTLVLLSIALAGIVAVRRRGTSD